MYIIASSVRPEMSFGSAASAFSYHSAADLMSFLARYARAIATLSDGAVVVLGLVLCLSRFDVRDDFLWQTRGRTGGARREDEVDRRVRLADGADGHLAARGLVARRRSGNRPRSGLHADDRVAAPVVGRGGERGGRRGGVFSRYRCALDGLTLFVLDRAADAAGLGCDGQGANGEHADHGHRGQQRSCLEHLRISPEIESHTPRPPQLTAERIVGSTIC
jgi:hypothetical protein